MSEQPMVVCCHHCGKEIAKELRCSRCREKSYCHVECQKAAWSAGHKHTCFPYDLIDQFWAFVKRSYEEDCALTADEYQQYPLFVNRHAALLLKEIAGSEGGSLAVFKQEPVAAMKLACLFFWDRRLLPVGRGVLLQNLKGENSQSNGKTGAVVSHIGGQLGPKRSYKVQVKDTSELLKLEASQLRMLPLNDKRHFKHSIEYRDWDGLLGNTEKRMHPYDFQLKDLQAQVPQGVSWEYREPYNNNVKWTKYHRILQEELESMYKMGSPHFLYRPEAPHCIGGQEGNTTEDEDSYVGNPPFSLPHDVSTRQVLFLDESKGGIMERDMYSGMRRQVRRVDPPGETPEEPLRLLSHMHVYNALATPYHLRKDQYCGLCFRTDMPLDQMECCGGYVCDTEDSYEMNSYQREGQCARNHRLNSICFWHHQEDHDGDWKTCQECQSFFSPFDYAVKALPMAMAGTCRRYNFDDNVRTDLDLTTIEFPKCHECQQPVDMTEETTRTLSLRKQMGDTTTKCKLHGGGFGRVNMEGLIQQK